MTRPPQISPLFPSPPLSRSTLTPPDEPVREVGIPFEQPPLGRPKRGTWVQSDQKPPTLKAQRLEPFFRPLLLSVGNDQPEALNGLGLFDQPGAEQELQVIARLMSIGRRRRRFDAVRQQGAAAVPRIPNARRDPRAPRHPGGVEGVPKKDGGLEAFTSQGLDYLPETPGACVFSVRIVNNQATRGGMRPIKLADPGLGEQNNFRPRIAFAQGLERRD